MSGSSSTPGRRLSPAITAVAVGLLLGAGRVAGADEAFLLGADVSALASRAEMASRFQEDGRPGSEIAILVKHGWNAFRLRVFVDPVRHAPDNSLEKTIPVAKEIKASGARLMIDLHYSDTWADPQHQEIPMAWRDMDAAQLEAQVEAYSAKVILRLREAGAMPDMVQVGNEVTGGMLWPVGHVRVPPSSVKLDAGPIQALPAPYDDARQWENFTRLLKAGIRGVRAASTGMEPRIVIHIDCGGDWPVTQWFFDHLAQAGVDFDLIGQSFYPYYHGTPEDLQENLSQSFRAYHKAILVAETGYSRSGGEAIRAERKYNLWPGTPDGQQQFLADVIGTVKRAAGGAGVFYWAPEGRQLGSGNSLWNADGSPGPAASVLASLATLLGRPESHLPPERP